MLIYVSDVPLKTESIVCKSKRSIVIDLFDFTTLLLIENDTVVLFHIVHTPT